VKYLELRADDSEDPQAWEDEQLNACETLWNCLDTPGILGYERFSLSSAPVFRERLTAYMAIRESMRPILDEVVAAYATLPEDHRTQILTGTKAILVQLSFFIFYEFNFDQTLNTIENNGAVALNEAVLAYIREFSLDLQKVIEVVCAVHYEYRPTIPSFDFSDEELDNFYYNVGSALFEMLDDIDQLPVDMAKKLAYGEISPEEAIVALRSDGGKMNAF
jgi:hypothetical protein